MNTRVNTQVNTGEAVIDLADAPALPRLAPSQQRALNRLYDDAPPFDVSCCCLSGRLHFVHAAPGLDTIETWGRHRVQLGPHAATLAIDAPGLAQLLDEPRPDHLPAELRTVLLADALHPLVEALKKTLRLRFDWMPDDTRSNSEAGEAGEAGEAIAAIASTTMPDGALGFEVRADDGAVALRGFASLDDPAAWETLVPVFARRRVDSSARQFDALRLPLRFELGSTTLALKELAGIRAGDVIGIERWAAFGSALQVTANAGGPAGLHIVGRADGSLITVTAMGDPRMNRDDPAAADPSLAGDPAGLPLSRLDALEVALRFEVGELSLTLGELKSLSPGHVFDLGQTLNRCDVRILAHGNLLGRGYLVAVGDRLGVRVSEFAPNEL